MYELKQETFRGSWVELGQIGPRLAAAGPRAGYRAHLVRHAPGASRLVRTWVLRARPGWLRLGVPRLGASNLGAPDASLAGAGLAGA